MRTLRLCGMFWQCECMSSFRFLISHAHRSQTFFISDPNAKDSNKSARACDACYDTVFPVLDRSASPPPPPSYTLSGFTSWQSMPALAMPNSPSRPASALMAIDISSPKRALARIDDVSEGTRTPASQFDDIFRSDISIGDSPSRPVIRVRPPPSRPRSFYQILEDFHDHTLESALPPSSPSASHFTARTDESSGPEHEFQLQLHSPSSLSLAGLASDAGGGGMSLPTTPRREDTARRSKRFSMPAIALHTTPVTARPKTTGEGIAKRFSLVLGGRGTSRERKNGADVDGGGPSSTLEDSPVRSAAAVRLGELLGRRKGQQGH